MPETLDPTDFEAAGLYDPAAPNAADRLALIRFNLEHGIELERMIEAAAEGRLAFVAEEPLISPGRERLTLGEAAERAGVDAEEMLAIWRAAGFPDPGPDDKVMTERVAGMVELLQAVKQLFGDEVTLQLVRVFGASIARIAEAECAAFLASVRNPIEDAGGGELAIAKANYQVALMMPQISQAMDVLHRHHLEATVRRMLITTDLEGLKSSGMAVGFVDLVGYTSFSSRLPTEELGRVLADFESRARDLVTGRGARVVKLIGDEVMFVAPGAAEGCDIALALVEELGSEGSLPPARAGLGWGEVLMQDGDYYGHVVNLASRIVGQARPGTLLVSQEARAQLKGNEDFRIQPIGTRKLKGYRSRVPLFAVKRRVGAEQKDATG